MCILGSIRAFHCVPVCVCESVCEMGVKNLYGQLFETLETLAAIHFQFFSVGILYLILEADPSSSGWNKGSGSAPGLEAACGGLRRKVGRDPMRAVEWDARQACRPGTEWHAASGCVCSLPSLYSCC